MGLVDFGELCQLHRDVFLALPEDVHVWPQDRHFVSSAGASKDARSAAAAKCESLLEVAGKDLLDVLNRKKPARVVGGRRFGEAEGKTTAPQKKPAPAQQAKKSGALKVPTAKAIAEAMMKLAPKPAQKPPTKPKGKVGRSEAGLVGMAPAPSDNLNHASHVGFAGDIVGQYVEMVVNPWSSSLMRLPDTCITPTALAKFYANRTYTIRSGSTASYGTSMILGLHSRMSVHGANGPYESSNSYQTAAAPTLTQNIPVYDYAPGDIMVPQQDRKSVV